MSSGRLRWGELVAGAHFEKQMTEANDVHVLHIAHISRPNNSINFRIQAQETIFQPG